MNRKKATEELKAADVHGQYSEFDVSFRDRPGVAVEIYRGSITVYLPAVFKYAPSEVISEALSCALARIRQTPAPVFGHLCCAFLLSPETVCRYRRKHLEGRGRRLPPKGAGGSCYKYLAHSLEKAKALLPDFNEVMNVLAFCWSDDDTPWVDEDAMAVFVPKRLNDAEIAGNGTLDRYVFEQAASVCSYDRGNMVEQPWLMERLKERYQR